MYIISAQDFEVPYDIPNANELDSKSAKLLDTLIDEEVRLLLQKVLGFTLFAEFDSNIENGSLKDDAAQKWKDLVNGKTYDGKRYEGLTKKMLVPLVYYNFIVKNQQSLTSLGVKALEANNASNVDPNPLAVMAWNTFVKEYQGSFNLCIDPLVYRFKNGTTFVDYFGIQQETGFVDLLTFLHDNKAIYPDAPLWMYQYKNRFE